VATIIAGSKRGRPGKWIVDYHDANGVRRWVTFRTRKAAKIKLGAVLAEDEPARSTTTLQEYAKKWLPQVKVTVKPATFESYEMMLRRHLLPGLGRKMRVQHLKPQHIRDLLVRKLQPTEEGGAGLARNNVRAMHATLRVMLQGARDTGLIRNNPALGLGKKLNLEKPLEARNEDIKAHPGFDAEQLTRFLITAARVAPTFVPLFQTLAFTGMRLGEALGLQWVDVDFTRHQILVQRTIGRGGRTGSPKSRKDRWVDMRPQLEQTLTRLREARNERQRPWLFWTRPGQPGDQRRQVRKVFARVVKAAKLPLHHTPHALRHSFASIQLAAGESVPYVQEQLGHQSIRMTVDLYGKSLRKRPQLGGVAELLEGELESQNGSFLVANSKSGAQNGPKSRRKTKKDPHWGNRRPPWRWRRRSSRPGSTRRARSIPRPRTCATWPRTWPSATRTEPNATWQVPGPAAPPRMSCARPSPSPSAPTPPRRTPTS
jgi:integrase